MASGLRTLGWLLLLLSLQAGVPTDAAQADEVALEKRLDALRAWPGGITPPGPSGRPTALPEGADWVAVGRRLFKDPRLSGDGTMSCATCHRPANGLSEPRAVASGHRGKRLGRHTPTVVDTALLSRFFWDGRAGSLAEQALGPMLSPDEMAGDRASIERLLDGDPVYKAAFRSAFGRGGTVEDAALALEAYERTLVSQSSRVDRYLAGDKRALDRREKLGLFVFTGKGSCTVCHVGPALSDGEFHALGLRPGEEPAQVDAGRMGVTVQKSDGGLSAPRPCGQLPRLHLTRMMIACRPSRPSSPSMIKARASVTRRSSSRSN